MDAQKVLRKLNPIPVLDGAALCALPLAFVYYAAPASYQILRGAILSQSPTMPLLMPAFDVMITLTYLAAGIVSLLGFALGTKELFSRQRSQSLTAALQSAATIYLRLGCYATAFAIYSKTLFEAAFTPQLLLAFPLYLATLLPATISLLYYFSPLLSVNIFDREKE